MGVRRVIEIFDRIFNKIMLKRHHVVVGRNVAINGRIKSVNFGGSIQIGNNVRINSSSRYNPIGGDTIARLISYGGNIIIGDNVGISNSTIISRARIEILDDVLIGGSCKIYDNDFHSLLYKKRISAKDDDIKSKPILIKKGAFIGAHSLILKGVTIGEQSVIGAGSIVTKSIPDGEIWAGNPAQFIKKVID